MSLLFNHVSSDVCISRTLNTLIIVFIKSFYIFIQNTLIKEWYKLKPEWELDSTFRVIKISSVHMNNIHCNQFNWSWARLLNSPKDYSRKDKLWTISHFTLFYKLNLSLSWHFSVKLLSVVLNKFNEQILTTRLNRISSWKSGFFLTLYCHYWAKDRCYEKC